MNPIWLMRMAKWVRNPPSPRTAALWIGVIVACLLVGGAEYLWGWPDWLTVNDRPRVQKP
jgi:hypothetical protein